jgi:archaellum component FlaC
MSDEMKLLESRILQSLNDVKKSQTTIIDSIQAVTERFDVLESRVADISTRQTEMDSKLRTLNQRVDDSKAQVAVDIEEQLRDLREEVQEERRKLIRLCNVVLFGVPETNEGLEVATKMISVLLPDWKGQIE